MASAEVREAWDLRHRRRLSRNEHTKARAKLHRRPVRLHDDGSASAVRILIYDDGDVCGVCHDVELASPMTSLRRISKKRCQARGAVGNTTCPLAASAGAARKARPAAVASMMAPGRFTPLTSVLS
jgi:hypothetical protein